MNVPRRKSLAAPLAAAPLALLLTAAPAGAASSVTYRAQLTSLNSSNASGTALLTLTGHQLEIHIVSKGLTPNAPHAQHIHGMPGGHNFCPGTTTADANHDGVLTTTEGVPDYGMIDIPLTTSGDYSVASGLAVDRFPKADASGSLVYNRTITVSDKVAKSIASLHIVQHGVDLNKDGRYDGSMKSDLDPKLPQEATAPADCGRIFPASAAASGSAPVGGAQTGAGGTSGVESKGILALGGLSLLGAGALLARRRSPSVR